MTIAAGPTSTGLTNAGPTSTGLTGTGAPPGHTRKIVVTVLAVCLLVGLAVWGGIAVFRTGPQGQAFHLEVTSRRGTVSNIEWRNPDGNKLHRAGSPFGRIRTPWSKDITVTATKGPITLNAIGEQGDMVTCRILLDGRVVEEQTGSWVAHCLTTMQRLSHVSGS